MKLKVYVVDLELPRWARRLVSRGLAAGAMAAVTLGGVAYAAIKYTYKSSDTLSSADMTDTLGDLNTRLKTAEQGRLVGTVNGKAYSVGATEFKVVTSKGGPLNNGTYNGKQVGGYPNAKSICETAVGSMTAHMCSSEELVRSVAGGLTPPRLGTAPASTRPMAQARSTPPGTAQDGRRHRR